MRHLQKKDVDTLREGQKLVILSADFYLHHDCRVGDTCTVREVTRSTATSSGFPAVLVSLDRNPYLPQVWGYYRRFAFPVDTWWDVWMGDSYAR